MKGPKKQQSLREHAETARRARMLVTLRDDLALDLDWETLKTSEPNVDALKALCIECGFHRFMSELPASRARRRGPDLGGRLSGRGYARAVRATF